MILQYHTNYLNDDNSKKHILCYICLLVILFCVIIIVINVNKQLD